MIFIFHDAAVFCHFLILSGKESVMAYVHPDEYGYEVVTASAGYPIMVYFHATEVNYVASHWHDSLEVVNYRDSECLLSYNGINVDLPKDALIIINSGHIHSLLPKASYDRGISLIFPSEFLSQYGIDISKNVFHYTAGEEIDSLLRECLHRFGEYYETREEDPYYSLRCSSEIFNVLHILMTHYQDRQTKITELPRHEKLCQQIIRYISQHYKEPLTLPFVAETFSLSEGYVCRLFRKYLGYTFKEHLTDIRLQSSISQILHTDKTLLSIAMDCGFPDYRSFVKSFQRMYGVKPQEYRENPVKFVPRFSRGVG